MCMFRLFMRAYQYGSIERNKCLRHQYIEREPNHECFSPHLHWNNCVKKSSTYTLRFYWNASPQLVSHDAWKNCLPAAFTSFSHLNASKILILIWDTWDQIRGENTQIKCTFRSGIEFTTMHYRAWSAVDEIWCANLKLCRYSTIWHLRVRVSASLTSPLSCLWLHFANVFEPNESFTHTKKEVEYSEFAGAVVYRSNFTQGRSIQYPPRCYCESHS